MTRSTNARVAGVAYLLYIGVAFPSMVIFGKATAGDNVPARLANDGLLWLATPTGPGARYSAICCCAAG